MWEYVFRVSSIFVCPKYFATNVTLAPLLINRDAHECLKSWILIRFNSALSAILEQYKYRVESAIGLQSEHTKKSSLKLAYVLLSYSYNSFKSFRRDLVIGTIRLLSLVFVLLNSNLPLLFRLEFNHQKRNVTRKAGQKNVYDNRAYENNERE